MIEREKGLMRGEEIKRLKTKIEQEMAEEATALMILRERTSPRVLKQWIRSFLPRKI